MSKYGRAPETIARDLVIACFHPRYRDRDVLETLRALRRARGEWV